MIFFLGDNEKNTYLCAKFCKALSRSCRGQNMNYRVSKMEFNDFQLLASKCLVARKTLSAIFLLCDPITTSHRNLQNRYSRWLFLFDDNQFNL